MNADTITAIKKADNAPDRIWATVNGMSTRLPDGARQLVGGWSQDAERAGAVEYVRASTLESLQRENERLRQFLFPYADSTEISGISWDGKYLIGDKASISAFREMENRGLQIDVYKRAYDQKEAALKSRAEAAESEVKRYREALHIISAGHACPIALANNALRPAALSSTGDTHGN